MEAAKDVARTLPAYTFHRCVALLVPVVFVSLHPEQVRAVSNAPQHDGRLLIPSPARHACILKFGT